MHKQALSLRRDKWSTLTKGKIPWLKALIIAMMLLSSGGHGRIDTEPPDGDPIYLVPSKPPTETG